MVQKLILPQFVWQPYIELTLETSLKKKMVSKEFLANLHFLGNEISVQMTVQLDNFYDFIDIFDD